jgi:hypothetical protein
VHLGQRDFDPVDELVVLVGEQPRLGPEVLPVDRREQGLSSLAARSPLRKLLALVTQPALSCRTTYRPMVGALLWIRGRGLTTESFGTLVATGTVTLRSSNSFTAGTQPSSRPVGSSSPP